LSRTATLSSSVTFQLESVPSSQRSFQFTTDVGSPPSFSLSAASPMQVYQTVVDGAYEVSLPEIQTTGYDVGVTCVGASYTAGTPTTQFTVAGDDVTCTFTLTGMFDRKRDSIVSSHFGATQIIRRRLRALQPTLSRRTTTTNVAPM
jgi:hypothetical protein